MTRETRDTQIIRDILVRVGESEHLNQRTLAKELGIALGMTNSYLKRCVRKGLIKVAQAPANRYLYYLTPHGFAEKSRLTAEFLSDSLTFFRRARNQYGLLFDDCVARGWTTIALAGMSELGEIALLYARDRELEPVGMIAPAHAGERFMGLPVVARAAALPAFDAVILTELQAPQRAHDALLDELSPARVLVPLLLSVEPQPRAAGGRA